MLSAIDYRFAHAATFSGKREDAQRKMIKSWLHSGRKPFSTPKTALPFACAIIDYKQYTRNISNIRHPCVGSGLTTHK